ncbi:M15 family metallopeptidase [Ureibacillus sp. Re31]|uniref:M15 family metallopeptidase n=1 Tax=Ureibacillus galli TaxID=2762222 RepID=A0ABR8XBA7_9BACL|nr:M15 family metallopeptidase [Ureibacillus galli]MBD8026501.1 M15 family metallopeptidase [Ureibacillus galli]
MKRSIYVNKKKNDKKKYIWIGVSTAIAIIVVVGAILFLKQYPQAIETKPNTTDVVKEKTEQPEQPVEEDVVPPEQTEKTEEPIKQQEQPLENGGYIEGQALPKEPTYVDGVLIANKKYPLPADFAPGESEEARAAFEKMAADAKKAGFDITAFSTYRSYEYQDTLYNNYVNRDGKENADRYSARPGYSEHQTGLAFDIGEKGKEDLWLTAEFGESEAGKWLVENADKYGFILRYPKGKEAITGYMYESWHFRYLGVDLATKVKESNLTLEEYLGIQ